MGVGDNLIIGDVVIMGVGMMVLVNVLKGCFMLGYFVMKMESQVEVYKGLCCLLCFFVDVVNLKKVVLKFVDSD